MNLIKYLHCLFSYYSMYGHVGKLAEEIRKGAASVEGVEAKLWQVPETLAEEVLGKLGAPPKSDVPVITADELSEADDATGGLWRTQALAGKPAGIFYSTGSQGGGQETTPLTSITQLVHHGMIFVPIGYTFGAGMFEIEKVKGGSPYGAGTYAGMVQGNLLSWNWLKLSIRESTLQALQRSSGDLHLPHWQTNRIVVSCHNKLLLHAKIYTDLVLWLIKRARN
ncbi:hypothetical protein RJT34_13543 [Clitoria ternatea]|uniref:Flavodoxin-like domain-containing protein n=1 Tax=Clitoria ternatea TaxID=43366 RepID=A0AAN9JNS0_CLITE